MIIDCIADLHGHFPKLEGGDLLIVAGDLTATDTIEEHLIFCDWLLKQNYKKIVWIAGNHDNRYQFYSLKGFFLSTDNRNKNHISYLCDSGTEFEGLKIWGSPWTKTFEGMNPDCKAFTCDTEEELDSKFSLIPDNTDILITHGPAYGIFDTVQKYPQDIPESCGSKSLLNWMKNKWKIFDSLKINIFGHIHEHGGKTGSINMIQFINASIMNERYEPVNKPIRVIL